MHIHVNPCIQDKKEFFHQQCVFTAKLISKQVSSPIHIKGVLLKLLWELNLLIAREDILRVYGPPSKKSFLFFFE